MTWGKPIVKTIGQQPSAAVRTNGAGQSPRLSLEIPRLLGEKFPHPSKVNVRPGEGEAEGQIRLEWTPEGQFAMVLTRDKIRRVMCPIFPPIPEGYLLQAFKCPVLEIGDCFMVLELPIKQWKAALNAS